MCFAKWIGIVTRAERVMDIYQTKGEMKPDSCRRRKGHLKAVNRLRSSVSNNMAGGIPIKAARVGCARNIHLFTSIPHCTLTF